MNDKPEFTALYAFSCACAVVAFHESNWNEPGLHEDEVIKRRKEATITHGHRFMEFYDDKFEARSSVEQIENCVAAINAWRDAYPELRIEEFNPSAPRSVVQIVNDAETRNVIPETWRK